VLQAWLGRMRNLPAMKSGAGFFPVHPDPEQA
jgi:hypothetical protein